MLINLKRRNISFTYLIFQTLIFSAAFIFSKLVIFAKIRNLLFQTISVKMHCYYRSSKVYKIASVIYVENGINWEKLLHCIEFLHLATMCLCDICMQNPAVKPLPGKMCFQYISVHCSKIKGTYKVKKISIFRIVLYGLWTSYRQNITVICDNHSSIEISISVT